MGKTILVVDDDPNIVDTAKDILEDAGYTVYAATTSAGALARQKSSPADLALLDFNLPDGLGADLAVKLRTASPQLVTILLTGQANVELGAAKSAISRVLTKPVNPAQLLDVIRSIVES